MASDPRARNDPEPLAVDVLLGRIAREAGDAQPRLIETHISWVLLAGEHAYKIRRPVRMPFVDFTAPEARRADCERELALNRRWAPSLYLSVVPVRGPRDDPSLDGDGPTVEHAVKMRRFPDEARLDRVAACGGLDAARIDELAATVAALHDAAPRAREEEGFGTPRAIGDEVRGNLDALAGAAGLAHREHLDTVRRVSLGRLGRLAPVFRARLREGFVRECHGDLHLENIALVDGRVTPFDGVEFEPALRWVDVASDLAFLLMDLHGRGHERHAWRALNRYLDATGDHALLRVLRHYLCYRAMVRAKVAALRAAQEGEAQRASRERAGALLALAESFCREPQAPALVITHGVSGSGKSWLAERLAPRLGAVWLRSDVERARLHPAEPGRYSKAATEATYARLAELAGLALGCRFPVIADATFLEAAPRERFAALAAVHGVTLCVLDLAAPAPLLERRIEARASRGDDPSQADTAVLARQLRDARPLAAPEGARTLRVDTSAHPDLDAIGDWVRLQQQAAGTASRP